MKEYHLIRDPDTDGYDQAFVVSVIRDEQDIALEEIFVITSIDGKEVKARLDIDALYELIEKKKGGNIPPSNFEKLFELIDPITPESVKLQNRIDLFEYECDYNQTEMLIRASEIAEFAHPTDFDSVIKDKFSE